MANAVLNRPFITVSVMLATAMQTLDTTIANVALPKMQGSVGASQDEIAWVLTSYIVAVAIMTPLSGWLAKAFGRKRVLLISIAGFTLTSALCGTADSLAQIVVYRLLQGLAGAALVPMAQAVLLDINPPEKQGQAMAMWGMGVTLAPVLGPVLGGWLTDDYSWRWVFYINLPIGIMAFLGIFFFVPDTREQTPRPFDFFGFGLLSVTIGAMQLMLDRGQSVDWFSSPEIIIYAVCAGLGFYLFIVHTCTAGRPFLSPALFKDRNFVTGNVFIFLVGILLFATLALVPPIFQTLMGYPVITTGIIMAPRGIGSMISMALVGKLVGKVDSRILIATGFGLTAISLWQMTQFSLQMGEWPVISSGVVQGMGVGLAYVPLSTVTFGTLPRTLRSEGTAFFSLLRNVGSSIGISAVQTLLVRNTQIVHASLAANITASSPNMLASHIDVHSPAALSALNGLITNQAAMIAYIDDFQMMLVLTLASIPLLLLLRVAKAKTSEEAVVVMD